MFYLFVISVSNSVLIFSFLTYSVYCYEVFVLYAATVFVFPIVSYLGMLLLELDYFANHLTSVIALRKYPLLFFKCKQLNVL